MRGCGKNKRIEGKTKGRGNDVKVVVLREYIKVAGIRKNYRNDEIGRDLY